MKTSSRMIETRLEESIVSLFQDLPALCGFTVQERAGIPDGGSSTLKGGLFLTDIGLYPQPPLEDAQLICEEIREALVELIEERPETTLLLAGKTFARALH